MGSFSRILGLIVGVVLLSGSVVAAPTAPGSGSATVSPLIAVVATPGKWTFVYSATDNFTNGSVRITIPSGWTAPQDGNSSAPGYVTVTSSQPSAGETLSISGQQITVSVANLPKTKTLTVLYGDDNGGTIPAARATPPTASNPSVAFLVESDPEGTDLQPIASSPVVNLQPGTITQLDFTNLPFMFTTAGEGGPYSVVAKDTYGNPSPVGADQQIDLSTTSPGGTFSVLGGVDFSSVTAVTMPSGSHTVTFYYRDTRVGSPTITASAQGQAWTDDTQQQTVSAGPPALLELSLADPTVTVDEFAQFTIHVTDAYGNPTNLPTSREFLLTSSAAAALSPTAASSPEQASGNFYLPGDHGTPITTLTMNSGEQTAQVDFRSTDANGGNPHLIVISNSDPPPLSGSANVTVEPGPVGASASVVDANTPTTADGSPSIVTITVTDQYGNPKPGVTVVLGCTGNAGHTNPGGPTDGSGQATGAVANTKAETVTVTATAGGVPLTDNAQILFVPGPVSAASSLVAGVTPVVADGATQSQITITAKDAFDNPVSGVAATLGVNPPGNGATLTQPPGLTDANGQAFGYLRSTKTGSRTVNAVVDGTPVTNTANILFVPGQAASFEWNFTGGATAGDPKDVSLTVRDALNNVVSDYADTAFVSTSSAGPEEWGLGGGALGEIDSLGNGQWFYLFNAGDNGVASLRVSVFRTGSITLSADDHDTASGTSSSLVVDNGPADKVILVSGNNQTAVAGSPVANDLVVRVTDEFNNVVDGVQVTFGNLTGGGTRDVVGGGGVDSVATTNGSGEASCDVWQLGPLVTASNTVTASIPSGSIPSVLFSATSTPGPGTTIVITPSSQNVTVNSTTTVYATLEDDNTNPVPNKVVSVFISDAANGQLQASPFHTTTGGTSFRQGTTDSNGQISVNYVAPAGAGFQDVLDATGDQATADDVPDVTYTSVASGATNLRFVWLSGSTSPAGQTFSFRVDAVDGSGNVDPTNASTVNLVPQGGSGIVFSLSDFGTQVTQVQLVAGQRTVYGRGTLAGLWTITLQDDGGVLGDDADQVQINNSSGGIDHYDVTAAVGSATAGENFNVTIVARDQYGNKVNGASNNVNLDPVDPGTHNVISPPLSVTQATLSAGQVILAENYTDARTIQIRARDAVLKQGFSGDVIIGPAAAHHIVRVTGDLNNVPAGNTVQHTAEVRDIYENTVPGENVSFSAPQGGGSVNPTSDQSDVNGQVTFDHTTGSVAGLNVARAQILDGSPTGLERAEWNVQTVAGGIDHYTVIPTTYTWTANNLVTVNVQAYDQNNNPVDDDLTNVQLTSTTGNVQYTSASGTLSNGVFSTTARDNVAEQTSLIVSTNGGEPKDTSNVVTVNPGVAYEVVKISGDGTISVGGTQPLLVLVRDQWLNPIGGFTVTFVVTSSPGSTATLTDPTGDPNDGITVTDAGGQATVNLHTSFQAGANLVRASISDGSPPALETKTFTVNTTAGAITHYDVVPAATQQLAGVKLGFTVTARDANNNVVDDDATPVDLSLAPGSGVFFFDADPKTLTNGTFTDSLQVNTPAPQTIRIRAETQGNSSIFGLSPDITINPNVAAGVGTITATAVPDTLTANGVTSSTITSGVIQDAYSNIVATGTKITVATSPVGSITGDADPVTPGIQRLTNSSGIITFILQSGTTSGIANVTMQAVSPGTASGSLQVPFAPKPVIANPTNLVKSIVVPGTSESFSVQVTNSSATGVTLSSLTTFFFSDGVDNFTANLAVPTYIDGGAQGTLNFANTAIPAGMAPGLYTPQITASGNDEFEFSFSQSPLLLAANSLRVTAIEIQSITPETPIVSRGQTKDITVAVRNQGPITATIESVTFTFSDGNQHFDYESILPSPVNIPGTTTVNIPVAVTVLQSAPVGPDSIDAAVSGNVSGTPVNDPSASPFALGTWTIQSGAQIAYEAGSLTPSTVSQGRTHSLKVRLINNGDTTVQLQTPATTISFTDGSVTYTASLSQNEAFGAGTSKEVTFNAVQVPLAMQTGTRDVALHFVGVENLEPFTSDTTTGAAGDFITVVTAANAVYVGGMLTPTTVTRTISHYFTLTVNNLGTAAVELNPALTTFSFGGSYTATLDGSFQTTIAGGTTTVLRFLPQVVNVAVGDYAPSLHLKGTENTLDYDRTPSISNQITVQNPANVSISSITPSQPSITRDQTNAINVTMKVTNNGTTGVRFKNTALTFLLNGSQDLTNRFVITPPSGFFNFGSGLPRGETDSLQFTVADNTGNSMTVGNYIIEGSLTVVDSIGGQDIPVNTAGGGKGTLTVQSPGILNITRIVPSQPSVTTNQTQPWTAGMTVKNTGEADIDLDLAPGSTFITFTVGTGWASANQTPGPITLGQNDSTTLVFNVTQSGNTAGNATINGSVRGIESNSAVVKTDATPPGAGSVLVQTPANIQITLVDALPDTVTENQTTPWTIPVTVQNNGGADVVLSNLTNETYIEFTTAVPVTRVTNPTGTLTLPGGQSRILTFTVSPTPGFGGVPGQKPFNVRIQGTENNRQLTLVATSSSSEVVELVPDPQYVLNSLAPTAVKAGESAHFQAQFTLPAGASLVDLDPSLTKLSFTDGTHNFAPALDTDSTRILGPGATTRIWFGEGNVPADFASGTFPIDIQLHGTENGNSFEKIFDNVANIEIRAPTTVRIDSMVVSRGRVSASQDRNWAVRMVVKNSGSGDVAMKTGATQTRLELRIGGTPVTSQYTVIPNPVFQNSGTNILGAGLTDTTVFTIDHTGSTTGNLSVYGIFAGTDVEAQRDVGDDTFDAGWGRVLVEVPGALQVTQTAPSQTQVTQGQTTPWTATATVRNNGGAAVRLTFDALNPDIQFVPDSGFDWTRPSQLQGGGTILAGGATGTLVFPVSPTGSATGTPAIHTIVAGVDTNSLNLTTWNTQAQRSGSGSIVVEGRGRAVVTSTTIVSPNQPSVNTGQDFGVRVLISNTGGADLQNVSYRITSDGGSGPTPPNGDTLVAPLIASGAAVVDTFFVTADNATGPETLTVDVVSGTDANSGQVGLLDVGPHVDQIANIAKQTPPNFVMNSVTPNQGTVTRLQTQDWFVDVAVSNTGGASLDVVTPSSADLSFFLSGSPLTGYVVLPPSRFVGRAGLRLGAGESDVLRYTVDVTGGTVGTVTIRADVQWRDVNDLSIANVVNTGTVNVVSPSGLFINTTRADPATAPNSPQPNLVLVNSGQSFDVLVNVQNVGAVEDVDSVQVRLVSDNPTNPLNLASEFADIPTNGQHTFRFTVNLPPLGGGETVRQEFLTSTIIKAISHNTGQPITPGAPVDNQEFVIVQKPASLSVSAGVSDNTVSTDQVFSVTGLVLNSGTAQVDASGALTLTLPPNFVFEASTPDSTVGFSLGSPVTWDVRAPSQAAADRPLVVRISTRPKDLNIGADAAVSDFDDTVLVDVATQGGFTAPLIDITLPAGAVDDTVSTTQQFTVRGRITASGTTADVTATLVLVSDPGLTVIDPLLRNLGHGTGGQLSTTWRITAPASAAPAELKVEFDGRDENTQNPVTQETDTLDVAIVDRALLSPSAVIARPPAATDGKVAIGSQFEIEGTISNLGTAGIDPTNARVRIDLSQAAGYTLAATSGPAERSFTIGQTIMWVIDAPDVPAPPRIIDVVISDVPLDENSGAAAAVDRFRASIAISTEGVFITADNISSDLGFNTNVVSKGTGDIQMLGIEIANTDEAADPARIDSIAVSVLDKSDGLAGQPSGTLGEFYALVGGRRVDGDLGLNPVVFDFTTVPGGLVLDPDGAAVDSIVFAVSIRDNASLDQIVLSIENGGDFRIKSTSSGNIVPVVDKTTFGTVTGRLRSQPLVILSNNFEEYAHNYPNPFRAGSEQTRIAYTMDADGAVAVKIFDVLGSLVYEKQYARGEPGTGSGPQEVTWDGRNMKGETVRNGIYICQLEAGGHSVKIRIAVAK